MRENVRRFDGRVGEYARYRERYEPEVLLPRLRDWCGFTPEWTVADVGAGTGMLSDVFLANGNRVIAIEPNEEMRAMCAELHGADAQLEIVDGTSEATGLADASVEMVTAGRARHWFDVERAMAEFRRVLRPDGWVMVVAFGRSHIGREENVAFEELLHERAVDKTDKHKAIAIYQSVGDYLPRDFHHEEICGTMTLAWDELLGIAMSLSSAPRVEDERYPYFEQGLRDYFARYAVDGVVTLDTRYWISVGRFNVA